VSRDDRGRREEEEEKGWKRTGERFARGDTKEIHRWQLAAVFFSLLSSLPFRGENFPYTVHFRSTGRYFPGIDYEP